ncbi:hypothetical protein [Mycobacteroides abscessus]|uniref:hypothetical protein n=1 Tax=Mycobacteroides abscessus TaxID=36809 RepID=UPI00025885CB|nr:hypothetical protein [Mycobacteroides abscessus]EIC62295.1 hypothetical protein S7W_24221 [Mycobacteroides abscessus M94]SKZ50099.1 Uncharacterised protein [Mycobacteroides abscessus subsp. abscessus]
MSATEDESPLTTEDKLRIAAVYVTASIDPLNAVTVVPSDIEELMSPRENNDIQRINDLLVGIHQRAESRDPLVPRPDEAPQLAWKQALPDVRGVIDNWDTVLTPTERDSIVERIGATFVTHTAVRWFGEQARSAERTPGFHAILLNGLRKHWTERLNAVLGDAANPAAVAAMAGELSTRAVTHEEFDAAVDNLFGTIEHLTVDEVPITELVADLVSDVPWLRPLIGTPLRLIPHRQGCGCTRCDPW